MLSTVIFVTPAPSHVVTVAVIGLITILAARLISSTVEGTFAQRFKRYLGVFTAPLLVFLFVIVVISIVEMVE